MSPARSPEPRGQPATKSPYGLIAGLALAAVLAPAILWLRGMSPDRQQSQAETQLPAIELPPANLAGDTQYLDDRDAFRVSTAALPNGQVRVSFQVADGYYLYRQKIRMQAPEPNSVTDIKVPPGAWHSDQYFGNSMVLRGQFDVTARVAGDSNEGAPLTVRLTYQGCADDGICYPPIHRVLMPGTPDTDTAAN